MATRLAVPIPVPPRRARENAGSTAAPVASKQKMPAAKLHWGFSPGIVAFDADEIERLRPSVALN